MAKLRQITPALPLLVVVFLLIAPYFGIINASGARFVMLVGILALMVSGLNMVLGYAGELSVGQVAFYAIGAYVAGFVGTHLGVSDVLIGLAAVIVLAIIVGLITGIPSLRLAGWPLAMVTFFLVMITPNLIEVLKPWTGGGVGTAVDRATLFGAELAAYPYYVFLVVVVALWFAVARNVILSPHGTGFLVLRKSPILASALGMSVFGTKLKVYVLGTIAPALGGALFAWLDGYVAPDTFSFGLAITVLAASVLGGGTSIYGAIFGAAVLQYTQDTLTGFNEYQAVLYGLFLIVIAIALPDGATGWMKGLVNKRWPSLFTHTHAPSTSGNGLCLKPIAGTAVSVEGLDKSFGGNHAVKGVSFTAEPGQITALIGTNGSGKTTVLNMVNGFLTPDGGTIGLSAPSVDSLVGLKPEKIARRGIARTFQTPMMPKGVTVLDFVSLGGYVHKTPGLLSTVLRLPGYRAQQRAAMGSAMSILRDLGLDHLANTDVDSLSLGNRRMVEVARCLTASPSVFLLDEVGSGLDEGDLATLENLLNAIRDAGATIIVVEHNFPLVMRLADKIHVLSRGETLIEGTPEQVRNDPVVIRDYLGHTEPSAHHS